MSVELLKTLKARLGPAVLATGSALGDEWALIRRDAWAEAGRALKELGAAHFIDLCGVDRGAALSEERFEVVLHLRRHRGGQRIRVKTRCTAADPTVPSLCATFPAANWFEREAFDLFGIRFEGHPNLKRLLCHQGFQGHALRKDFDRRRRGAIPVPDTLMDEMQAKGEGQRAKGEAYERTRVREYESTYLNIGPSHPAMHGCFRVLVELQGERIIRAVPELGYLHRCFEKEAEAHTWTGVIPYTDRLNYVSPIMNNVGYCLAVEKLIGLDVPERAGWLRMLTSEVARICDHLVAVGANLVDIGALTNFWYLFNAREAFTDWLEALTGARLTASYGRIGGVSRDLPMGSEAELTSCIAGLRRAVKDVRRLILGNRIFLDRTQGVGAISEEEAFELGFTGPCLRAAGGAYDVRRDHPYLFYGDVEWEIPLGTAGDTYDRIVVRLEEMEQSARICEQVLARMAPGPVMTDRRDLALPPPHEVYGSIEGMIAHFELCMRGLKVPAGEVYGYTEAANGELGFYVISDGGERPDRIKVRPPCFPIYQSFPRLIEGGLIADAVAVMGSLNIVAGELDR